jgi:hypothetical protein
MRGFAARHSSIHQLAWITCIVEFIYIKLHGSIHELHHSIHLLHGLLASSNSSTYNYIVPLHLLHGLLASSNSSTYNYIVPFTYSMVPLRNCIGPFMCCMDYLHHQILLHRITWFHSLIAEFYSRTPLFHSQLHRQILLHRIT